MRRVFCALLAMVPLSVASAQGADPGDSARADEAPSLDQVVVTGSRIIQNGDDFPTPVTVVSTDQLTLAAPSNIPDGLNKLPIFSGVNGQRLSFGNASGNISGNYLNLREFGAVRTLILLNGKRVPPTTADGLVDSDLLPQMLVQRVDVVTGGASAVYGSDAITGVVNYVLDNKFEGFKTVASKGISQKGDFEQLRLGGAFGASLFGGRGHVIGSVEYFDNPGLLTTDARENTRRVYMTTGSGTAANPFVISPDVRWAGFVSPHGKIFGVLGPDPAGLSGEVFVPGGEVRPFVNGAPTNSPGYESGGDGFYFQATSVAASLTTKQAFSRFNFDLTDDLRLYAQGSWSEAQNLFTFAPFSYFPAFIAADNAFLGANVRAALAGSGAAGLIFGKVATNHPGDQVDTRAKNYYVSAGATGKVTDQLQFDLSYGRAETRQRVTNVNNPSTQRLAAALDAVNSGGQVVCRVTLTNPQLYPGCVPINPFGDGSESGAAFDYVTDNTNFLLTNTLDDISGSLTGPLFENWAGPVNFAISGEWRRATLKNVSSAQPSTPPDCTGLSPINCGSPPFYTQTYIFNIVSDIPQVSQSVTEGAIELDFPLLNDARFAEALSLNGAWRYADYSSVGGASTWKLGLMWQLTDDFTIRTTRSRDFRAPTLVNLYAPGSTGISGFNDLHTGTTGPPVLATTGPNPNLEAEISNALTAGFVYKPSFIRNLSLAVDFYSFRISNAIGAVTPVDPVVQQQCEASNGTSELCALMTRPGPFSDRSPANRLTAYFSRPLNAARLETRGVDLEVNYATEVGGGSLSLRTLGSYQPRYISQPFPGGRTFDASGAILGLYGGAVQMPEYRFTGFFNYTRGAFSVDIVERWRSSLKRSADPTLVFTEGDIPSIAYTDLTLTARPGFFQKSEIFLSVQNLFDKQAPLYSPPNSTLPGWGGAPILFRDDLIGRYFTLGVRMQF